MWLTLQFNLDLPPLLTPGVRYGIDAADRHDDDAASLVMVASVEVRPSYVVLDLAE